MSEKGNRFQAFLTALLVMAALAVATASVHREFSQGPSVQRTLGGPPVFVKGWEESLPDAQRVGPANASIKLIEFGDFECPSCRRFQTSLRSVQAAHKDTIAVYFLHYPLSYHRFARLAARAAECAAAQGFFGSMADALYAGQDSLGIKSWLRYAVAAGVPDTLSFMHCNGSTDPIPRVEAGLAHGPKLGVAGTPTVIINGWRVDYPVDSTALELSIQRALAAVESRK